MRLRRSHWGWGEADRFPDRATRVALGVHAAAVLGFAPGEPEEPVPVDALDLRPPRLEAPAGLAATVDVEARAGRSYGRGYRDLVRGMRGQFAAAPDVVLLPKTEADVVAAMAWAERDGFALIPYGGGTSVVGGVELPEDRGPRVCLDLRGLDQLVEVDSVSRLARFQAGVTGPALEAALAPHGLTLRHFPQSFAFSTLGGWIATRAGGHFATVYTHIDDLVHSVRLVAPAGVLETPRVPASGAGPDPARLVIGSEGALGVISEAWMRVFPKPTHRAKAAVRFTDWHQAVTGARAVAQSGLHPTNCRLLDRREATLNGVASDGSHVLLLGFESATQSVMWSLDAAIALAVGEGGTLSSRREGAEDSDGAAWKSAFLNAPYLQTTLVSLGVLVDTFETCCTWSAFPALHADLVDSVRTALGAHCGEGRISCRFSHVYADGPAPYYTFFGPARRGAELEQWAGVKAAASEALARHGATITHHHAVGRVHRGGWERECPALFRDVLTAAKARLDPRGILNPGVLVG